MKLGFINLKKFPYEIYNIQKKTGNRIEYSLKLTDDLKKLATNISSVPLAYASIVRAYPGDEDQEFHADFKEGERAIIYLTDVNEESNGPIEFKEHGKILGNAGTFVHYDANTIHRGCKSDIERFALAFAFDNSNKIETIGIIAEPCSGFECPSDYENIYPGSGDDTIENCCKKKTKPMSMFLIVVVVVVAIIISLRLFRFKH